MKAEIKNDSLHFIENLATNAWPCHTQELIENWRIRATFGVSKRANSVHTIGEMPQDPKWLQRIESFYKDKSIPPCFYISDISPTGLDSILESKGYRKLDECFIMTASCLDIMNHEIENSTWTIDCLSKPDSKWIDEFIDLEGFPKDRYKAYNHIFSSIKPIKNFLRISIKDETVGLGTVVVEDGWGCISNIVVNPKHRRKGIANQIINHLSKWAYENSAHHMYLQVIQTNHPAVNLYKKIGFSPISKHHYRILKAN